VGLSPMDGVTDAPMRYITAKYGKPDVTFTEFVSADGIAYENRKFGKIEAENLGIEASEIGKTISGIKKSLKRDFKFDEIERPVVAQIFGGDPESFFVAAKLVLDLGFDGVDINMGCPARKVAGRGEGSGLIKNPELAGEIIAAVKRAVDGKIPVSVKTRIGYNEPSPEWWKFLATQDLAAVTMHGRTFKQLYQGKADWEAIGEAAKIIKSEKTIFFGNGDVENRKMGEEKAIQYGLDGVLIGRAAGGNPWAFCPHPPAKAGIPREKLLVAVEHSRKFEELFPNDRFFIMRKHLSWYARGFDNASDLRNKLVMCNSADEVKREVENFLG